MTSFYEWKKLNQLKLLLIMNYPNKRILYLFILGYFLMLLKIISRMFPKKGFFSYKEKNPHTCWLLVTHLVQNKWD